VFGSKCFVHVPQEKRKKLDLVAEEGILLGYEANSKGYRILRKSDGAVQVSKDVKFLEAETVEDGLDELGGARDLSRVSPLDSPGAGATPMGAASAREDPQPEGGDENGEILMLPNERELVEDAEPEVTNNAADPRPETVERKYGLRKHRKPNSRYPEHEYVRSNSARGEAKVDPQSRAEAMAGEDAELWRKAEEEEIASLLENKTWSVQTPPEGVKPVPVKWDNKIKRDATGGIERYKARLCAKGYKQKHGVDFEEVFAPISRHPTVRALLAVAAIEDLEVEQLDVKTAFLNGELEEEIWAAQPKDFEVGGSDQKLKLEKALYGLKQAPRAWYLKLAAEMGTLGFKPSSADSALFVWREDDGGLTYAAVWVDDSLVVGKPDAVQRTKEARSSFRFPGPG
jgi:hypothetical protein